MSEDAHNEHLEPDGVATRKVLIFAVGILIFLAASIGGLYVTFVELDAGKPHSGHKTVSASAAGSRPGARAACVAGKTAQRIKHLSLARFQPQARGNPHRTRDANHRSTWRERLCSDRNERASTTERLAYPAIGVADRSAAAKIGNARRATSIPIIANGRNAVRWLVLLINLALTATAWANVSPAQLEKVRVDAAAGALFPMSLRFAEVDGVVHTLAQVVGDRPAVLIFADYTCSNLCGPILSFAAAGLSQSGLTPGRDFHLVVIGLDPKDGARQARAMKSTRIGEHGALADASVFLIGNAPALGAAAKAAGYHYVYDKEHDRFAHPAAAYVINQNGAIVRVLSGLGLSGDNLRLALVDASLGRVGTLLDQIRLCCFGFDPARGIYTASIARILTIACLSAVSFLAGGVLFLMFKRRGRAV